MRLRQKTKKALVGYGFIGSWIVGFFLFTLVPIVQSLSYSMTNSQITAEGVIGESVKFTNYVNVFVRDVYFLEALWNYFSTLFVTLVSILVFSVLIAVLLNKKFFLRGFWRTVYFLPVIIASGPVLKKLRELGAMNVMPSSLGLFGFVNDTVPAVFMDSIDLVFSRIILILWFTGVPVLIFLAGLQKINTHLYEAARVDGASGWEIFWKIVLPSLKPLVNVNLIYTVVSLAMFSSNEIMYLIDVKKLSQFGYSNALAWVYFLLTVLFLGIMLLLFNVKDMARAKKKTTLMRFEKTEFVRKEA